HVDLRLARTTLFPYTTLFRSLARGLAGRLLERGGLDSLGHLVRKVLGRVADDSGLGHVDPAGLQGLAGGGQRAGQAFGEVDEGGDRKSTRLNSSHVKISYAVF